MKPLPNPVKINVTFIYTNADNEKIPVRYIGPDDKLPELFSRVSTQTGELLTVANNKLARNFSQSLNIPGLVVDKK